MFLEEEYNASTIRIKKNPKQQNNQTKPNQTGTTCTV